MKYVVFEYPNGARFPVLFGNHVVHSSIKLEHGRNHMAKPISAGEWKLAGGRVVTFGESKSLGLKPRKTDAKMIMLTLANADALLIAENCRFIERKEARALEAAIGQPAPPKEGGS